MKILEEFKTFAMKGNVIDLAVWVVIWGAFWKIVSSLVADVITPTVWILVWWINFTKLGYTITNLKWVEVTITYGNFLQTTFDFLIIAFSIFIVVKIINRAQEKVIKKQKADEKKEEAKKADDILLLEEIRDLLKWDKKSKTASKAEPIKEIITPIEVKITPKKIVTKKAPVENNTKKTKTTKTSTKKEKKVK